MVEVIYYAGGRLVPSLIVICGLIGLSIPKTVYFLLNPFHLQQKMLLITQNLLTHEVLPLFLGFILCIQAALHLINTRLRRINQTPEKVILEHIWPTISGLNITSLLLYIYAISSIFIGSYFISNYFLGFTSYELLLHFSSVNTLYDLIYSAFKTLILCIVVSFASGYYYYEAAVKHISLRQAVSRIMTRGTFWLVVVSVYLTYII